MIRYFLLALAISIFSVKCHSKIIDGIAAIVNDDVITISELNEKLAPLKEQIKNLNLPSREKEKKFVEIKEKILNKLIDERLIEQFGKKLGYKVSEEDVDNVIQDILRRNGITLDELKKTLKENNLSYRGYRENLKREIMVARVVNSYVRKSIKIPKEKIQEYIKKHFHPDADTEYHIKQILFLKKNLDQKKEIIDKVLGILKKSKNANFSELARKYSEGPFKDSGGDLGFFKKKELLPEIAKEIEKMKVGDVRVVKTHLGLHIIKLVDVKTKDQKISVLMKRAEEELKDESFNKKLKEWIEELRQKALIIKKI